MQKAVKELRMRRKDESSTKKVPIENLSVRVSAQPYKKSSNSIPISLIPKTIYLNSGELCRPKSKSKMDQNKLEVKPTASQSHSR